MRRVPVAALLSSLILVGTTAAAFATHTVSTTCFGQTVQIKGTDGDDSNLQGTPTADVIAAGAGTDSIYPLDGHDRVCGDDGNDFSLGDGGLDRLAGNNGADVMRGEAGADYEVQGNTDGDGVYGGEDADAAIRGGGGSDTVNGGLAGDSLYDGTGDDTIDGGDGSDTWFQCADGSGTNDTYISIEAFAGPSSSYC